MKKFFALALYIFSFAASACHLLTGDLEINGKTIKVNQKIDMGQTYTFSSDPYQLNVKVTSPQSGRFMISANVMKKNGIQLEKLNSGLLLVGENIPGSIVVQEKNSPTPAATYNFTIKPI